MDFSSKLASPSWKHLMGTDHFGRDIFARIIYGARISFQVGIATVLIGFVSGIIIGAIAGFIGGFWDGLIMRIMDSLLAFPPLLLAIGLAASMKPSLTTVCISIGVVYIPRFAYVMRGSVLVEREKEYVEAARAIGQSNTKILLKHIWPSCISPVIVLATVIFAIAIIAEATLSFLGVGIPPPAPSWGTMLSESRRYLSSSIYPALFPGLAISIAVLGSNLLGDGLRDILDPRIYTKIK
jgi:ABC-type dipeptide/oligopeptide/nickel transport system permease subunit